MTTTTLFDTDQQLLSGLMGRLGYVPVAQGGTQLRGIRNPNGSLRWVWAATLRQPLFLEFYSAASPKARLFGGLVQLAFWLGLHRWLFPVLPGRYACAGTQHWSPVGFALFLGTPGPFRKAVCCYPDGAGQLLFAKLPLTPAADAKVQAEAQALRSLAARPATTYRVPAVVTARPGLLAQRSVKPAHARRATRLMPAHFRFLQEQLRTTTTHQTLAATPFWHTVVRQLTELGELRETRIPYGLRAKLQLVMGSIEPEQTVALAFAHGDFTPWNCWLGRNELAIYDLEFAQDAAPQLYDLFHFGVQEGLLMSRRPAAQIRRQLWAQAQAHFPAIPEAQLRLAWQLYLLHQVSSYALIYHAQPEWHTQVEWLLGGWSALLTLELAAHTEHRQLCLFDLLDALPAHEGVVLKQRAANAYYPAPTSDVDLLLPRLNAGELAGWLRTFPLVRSAGVRRQAHMVSVDCFFQDGSFLSVDLLHQLHRKGLQLLDTDDVLDHVDPSAPGVPVLALHHDFEYTWLFYWLNQSSMPAGHLHYFQQQSPQEQQELLHHLVDKYNLHFDSVASAAQYQPLIGRQLALMIRNQPSNSTVRRLARTVRYGLSTVASFFRPNGFVVTFSGVDGAGKSTVIEHVKERLEKKWRKRVVVIRHRPSVLPILSAWKYGRAGAEQRAGASLPRQGANQRLTSSLARFAYYYLDYVLGQGVVWLKYTCRGHIVLYDRYYFDFINDSRRSNIAVPERLTRALYAFVNKPRLNFFLYAAPEVILRRKQELSGETIVQLTTKYQDLFGQLAGRYRQSQYVPIENHNLDDTLALIGGYLQQEIK
ncbi:hypothetical protein [Hymenobacter canadensis]|uniref:Thymidylate kinase n=1 Tax=Hymenobacter canadensis TaxID=2999067 RepID=A0ABY7LRB4_9BACT|nr:hypothetical protein [Hymenobacter canadensis]WBA42389.1 hypothetical protein O3303_02255 [Hymenobacter canadensis]